MHDLPAIYLLVGAAIAAFTIIFGTAALVACYLDGSR